MKESIQASKNGFTLMEMLIVVTIMAVLAAVILPRVMSSSDSAKKSVHLSERKSINTQIELFNLKFGSYPSAMTTAGWGATDSDGNGVADSLEFWPEGVPPTCNRGTAWDIDTTTRRVSLSGHSGHE